MRCRITRRGNAGWSSSATSADTPSRSRPRCSTYRLATRAASGMWRAHDSVRPSMEPTQQTDRFQAANEIFAAALALPKEERTRFLDHRCAGDVTLHQSVQRLLSKFDQLGDFLEEPAYA